MNVLNSLGFELCILTPFKFSLHLKMSMPHIEIIVIDMLSNLKLHKKLNHDISCLMNVLNSLGLECDESFKTNKI